MVLAVGSGISNMNISDLKIYLHATGWSESSIVANHYIKENTQGLVAFDYSSGQAFIVEKVGDFPWSKISEIEQFERDLHQLNAVADSSLLLSRERSH